MKRLLSRSAVAFSLILAACSGGSDDTGPVTPPPTPTIGVALSSGAGTVARNATSTTNVTLTRGGNYTGEVTLTATGAPAGVTVAFAPAALSGATTSSVATISVAGTAAPGQASITITASGNGVTAASATYALTIPTPAIALTAGATALSVVQGASGTVPVTITRSNGFTDAVTLAVGGLPAGVTGTFNPATIAAGATSSTLTLNVGAAVAAASTPITITASGTGVTAQTATVNLTVTAAATPAISLTATPAAVNITAGQAGTSNIGINRTGGFAGAVTLAVTGLPTGMTAAFSATTVAAGATTSTLTLTTTAAVAAGTYNLTVRGSGTGVADQTTSVAVTVAAAPGVTLSAIGAQQLSQGTSSPSPLAIIITRVGGLTGDLTMALEGAPTGVTATFTPNPATGPSVQMTLHASASAAPGTYNLTVRASGAGNVSGTTPVALTVTAAAQGSFALAAVPSTVTGQQGATVQSTINIARAGGFTGAVNLTVTGLPTGATGTFTPASATGTQSTLGIQLGAATPVGNHTITVRGQGAGVADVTTTITLTVTASGGGGTGNVNWRFCDLNDLPIYFAYRAGSSGAWTRVTPAANNTYSFSLNGAGQVVIVRPADGGGNAVFQYNFTADEMASTATFECQQNPTSKTLRASVTGLGAAESANVSVGGSAMTLAKADTNYTMLNVSEGVSDLLAFRTSTVLGPNFIPTTVPNKGVLRRNVNYPTGSTIPVINFNGAESFVPVSATYTLSGATPGEYTVLTSFFSTANGTSAGFLFGSLLNTTATATVYGVPNNLLVNGDFHAAMGVSLAQDASTQRMVYQFNRELGNRTLSLGPNLNAPTVASLPGAPYARLRSSGSWQSEYNDGIGVTFSQGTNASNTRSWTISQSRAFDAANAYQLEIPDLSGTSGWNNAWALSSGMQTNASTSATGGAVQAFVTPAENASFRQASRTAQITP